MKDLKFIYRLDGCISWTLNNRIEERQLEWLGHGHRMEKTNTELKYSAKKGKETQRNLGHGGRNTGIRNHKYGKRI